VDYADVLVRSVAPVKIKHAGETRACMTDIVLLIVLGVDFTEPSWIALALRCQPG